MNISKGETPKHLWVSVPVFSLPRSTAVLSDGQTELSGFPFMPSSSCSVTGTTRLCSFALSPQVFIDTDEISPG